MERPTWHAVGDTPPSAASGCASFSCWLACASIARIESIADCKPSTRSIIGRCEGEGDARGLPARPVRADINGLRTGLPRRLPPVRISPRRSIAREKARSSASGVVFCIR